MEEYITRAEFEQFKKHIEQKTDEVKAVRVEVASKDVLDRLDELKIDARAYTSDAAIFKNKVERVESDVSTIKSDVGTLKTDMGTLKSDVEQVKTVQSGHSKFFEEHGKRLAAMATKDDIARLEGLIKQIIDKQSS